MLPRMLYLWVTLATTSLVAPQSPPPKFGALAAAPGSVTLPAEVRGEVGAFVVIQAQTDGKAVRFVPLDAGLSVFPSELLNNRKVTVVVAAKPGKYRILAYSAAGDEPGEPAFTTVIIGNPQPEPPPVPPGPGPGPNPQPGGAYYFLLIRADGPASPAFTQIVSDPAWNKLRMKGHSIKDKTVTEAAAAGVKLPNGTTLPVVVTLQLSADGTTSKIVRPAIPLPDTAAGIEALTNDLP